MSILHTGTACLRQIDAIIWTVLTHRTAEVDEAWLQQIALRLREAAMEIETELRRREQTAREAQHEHHV